MAVAAAACQACGWAAALCSMLAFGSFGVPIKSEAAQSVDIDPLVFQSYKTFVCFSTSWLILLTGEPFHFSPWGIVSGFFWVPGGIATVYAIKSAGLAIGIGMGSSGIVLSSFLWGIFFFREKVHSIPAACFAIVCLMTGLLGMSYYSSPDKSSKASAAEFSSTLQLSSLHTTPVRSNSSGAVLVRPLTPRRNASTSEKNTTSSSGSPGATQHRPLTPNRVRRNASTSEAIDGIGSNSDRGEKGARSATKLINRGRPGLSPANSFGSGLSECCSDKADEENALLGKLTMQPMLLPSSKIVVVLGYRIPKREWGKFIAVVFGLWGGSVMAPMKMSDAHGSHFLLSFGIGSASVNVLFWVIRYLYNVRHYDSFTEGYLNLPSFHIRVMWLAGGLSGLLWSIGNFFSLLSVFYLGQGVGFPLVQSQMLISGLWGIFYFKEVQGTEKIFKWLLSSLVTLAGILMLGYQHVDE